MKINTKKIELIFAFLLTIFFLKFALENFDKKVFIEFYKSINYSQIVFALFFLTTAHLIRVYRWWYLLHEFSPNLKLSKCFNPYFSSLALNNLLPFRIGDIYRCFYLNNLRNKLSPAKVIGTLVIERTFDIISISIYFIIGYIILENKELIKSFEYNINYLISISLIFFLILLIIYAFSFQNKDNYYLKQFLNKLKKIKVDFLLSIKSVLSLKKITILLLISIFNWFLEGFVYTSIIANYFYLMANWFGGWFAMSIATLSTLIPSSPGYIGTFHFFTSKALIAYKIPEDIATVSSIFIHAFIWTPLTIIGLIFFLKSKKESLINFLKQNQ